MKDFGLTAHLLSNVTGCNAFVVVSDQLLRNEK